MDKLIPVINRLQDVFSTLSIESLQMPMIAVVGSQSSGKSSVLENIVGRDFLPRGTGIVTRCPLILQLHHTLAPADKTAANSDEHGVFGHLPSRKFFDFKEICAEITAQTDRLTGKNLGITNTPIELRIYSPHVVNLTLVDLPGITKVPVGDQPADIEDQIKNLIYSYIRNPNCIILAISAANSDIANSDAIKLAKDADPYGNRTLAVCTKLDLMDQGTDALDVLKGKIVNVKLGVIGVVNRSQRDIINKTPIAKARVAEAEYFRTHPVYSTLGHRAGTSFLVSTLNAILLQHIRECLPDLKERITSLLTMAQQRIASLGGEVAGLPHTHATAMTAAASKIASTTEKNGLLLSILTSFASDYVSTLDGTSKELSTSELSGGARILYIFNETFGATLDSLWALDGLEASDIRTAIKNATGTRMSLFVPEICFEILVKKQISKMLSLAIRCAELVYDEMVRITYQCLAETNCSQPCEDPSSALASALSSTNNCSSNTNTSTSTSTSVALSRFNNLNTAIASAVKKLLSDRMVPALDQINTIFGMELSYINTNHPDFIGGQKAVKLLDAQHGDKHSSHNNDLYAYHGSEYSSSDTAKIINSVFTKPGLRERRFGGHENKFGFHNETTSSSAHAAIHHLLGTNGNFNSDNSLDHIIDKLSMGGGGGTTSARSANASSTPPPPASSSSTSSSAGTDVSGSRNFLSRLYHWNAAAANPTPSAEPESPPKMGRASNSSHQTHFEAGFPQKQDTYTSSGLLDHAPSHYNAMDPLNDHEAKAIELIMSLVSSYFNVAKKNVQDQVPKAIMYFMVNHIKENLHSHLITTLYNANQLDHLLSENPEVVKERSELEKRIEALKRASDILSQVRDVSIMGNRSWE